MNSTIFFASRVNLRVFLALFALVLFSGSVNIEAQSLKFAPVLYGVESVNGTQANNVNALNGPNAVAVDPLGNLFILDGGHSQIRKVDPTGTASLLAGEGVNSYTGDNGPAVNATFYYPSAIATDSVGNVYVADTYSYAIRRIDAGTGIITTVAGGHGAATGVVGNGSAATSAQLQAPAGVAVDSNGNIYISDGAVVRRVDATGIITTFAGGGTPTTGNGDGGAATSASLTSPAGLAVDASNNLYIVDANQVRMVNVLNNNITTFAGTGAHSYTGDGGLATAATFLTARGVSVDGSGNVYIGDQGGYIRVVNTSHIISTLAGNSAGSTGLGDGTLPTQASFAPYGVAADTAGNVYFPVSSTNKVYKIVTHPERFPMTPVGTSSPSQRIIIVNTGTTDITYTSLTVSGDFANVPFNQYLSNNQACTATTTGTHTITAGFNNYCEFDVVFTPTAAGVRSFPLTIVSNDTPTTLTENVTSTGLASTLATTGGLIFTIAGDYGLTPGNYNDGSLATASSLVEPEGIVTDSTGNVYFVEEPYCRVRKIDAVTGILTTIAGINAATCGSLNTSYNANGDGGPATQAKLYNPSSIAMDANGNIFIGDSGHEQIREISGGIINRIAGTGAHGCTFAGNNGPAITAEFCSVDGLAVDKLGNIYFTDRTSELIRKIDTTGTISILAGMYPGTGSFTHGYSPDGLGTGMLLYDPVGLALDVTQKNLIFSEFDNGVVRKLNLATDMVTTIAGVHGTTGYSGDGGLATAATLYAPHAIAVDAANDIFIADSQNNVIRKIDGSTGIITTVAGNFVQNDLYNGDGIPATSAGLNYPESVAVDANGYLLLADRSPLIREVSPNGSLSFGNQLVSTTSSAQTVTISNIGNTPMTFANPAYGVSGDFAFVSGGTCTFTTPLVTGSSCTVKVDFAPTAVGERFGLLAYYDNGVASPQLTQLRGVGTAPAQPIGQTISLTNPGTKSYGVAAFTPVATATSGLPVAITVQSGPATINGSGVLSITGVGTVVLAANQAGNASYLAAPQVTASFVVSPVALTVTANPLSIGYGSAIPTTDTVTISGFVNGDTMSVVTGAATVSTTATTSSPVGSYPITPIQGTLTAANYTFIFVAGTLSITQGTQTITFGTVGNHTYGDAAFTVTATTTSGLPVTLTIKSGNATIANGVVSLTGVGAVVVQGVQAGNANYGAATAVTASFTVAKAVLTVTAQPATMVYGTTTLPTFTGVIAGYVNNETASVVTGTATYSTTAGSTSAVGSYPITPVVSSLSATNYSFNGVAGSLSVTTAALTITPNAATRVYGAANPTFTGTVVGLRNGDNPAITYSVTATTTSAPGTYPISAAVAAIAGNNNYTATVTPVNLTVSKANTTTTISVTQVLDVENVDTLTATVTSSTSGTPTGTVTFYDNNGVTAIGQGTFIQGTGYVLTTSNFTGGVHSITATYSGDTNFFGSTTANAGISTIGDYSFTASPSTLTITAGGTGTTSITFTPTFGWTGTQTPSCTGLKTGEICTFLPTSFTSNGSNTPSSVTLTITTTAAHAAPGIATSGFGWGRLSLAGMLILLPLWVIVRRRRSVYGVTLFLLLAMVMMMQTGCGTGSPAANPNATPTGAGALVVGFSGGDAAHQLNLAVTVQ